MPEAVHLSVTQILGERMRELACKLGSQGPITFRRAAAEFELRYNQREDGDRATNHLAYVGWQDHTKSYLPPEKTNKSSLERFFYVVHDMTKRQASLNIEKFATSSCRTPFPGCGGLKGKLCEACRRFWRAAKAASHREGSSLPS